MSILKQTLMEMMAVPARDSGVHTGDQFETVGGWEVIKRVHSLARNAERNADGDIEELITRIVNRLNMSIMRITKIGEYLFYSTGLQHGAVCNVNPKTKQLRIITILPTGSGFARPGTAKVVIEGFQCDFIEIT